LHSPSTAKAGETATNIAAVAAPKSSLFMTPSFAPRSKYQMAVVEQLARAALWRDTLPPRAFERGALVAPVIENDGNF
jgi:hypothetical protein